MKKLIRLLLSTSFILMLGSVPTSEGLGGLLPSPEINLAIPELPCYVSGEDRVVRGSETIWLYYDPTNGSVVRHSTCVIYGRVVAERLDVLSVTEEIWEMIDYELLDRLLEARENSEADRHPILDGHVFSEKGVVT